MSVTIVLYSLTRHQEAINLMRRLISTDDVGVYLVCRCGDCLEDGSDLVGEFEDGD